MSIGPDIKEAIVEVGTKFIIERDSGDITGGYLNFGSNAQVTKPFIREFFLEAEFCYDTTIVGGDIVKFNTTGTRYIVMNYTPILFENEIIKWEVVLYKTNEVIQILRSVNARNLQTYLMEVRWEIKETDRPALITSPLYGTDLDTDEELGLIGLELNEMYIPSAYDYAVHDRIRLSDGDYFRVEAVKKRRYQGVDVVEIGFDTRATSSSTTTTTSSSTTTTTTA